MTASPIVLGARPLDRREVKARTRELVAARPDLAERLRVIRGFARGVQACEVHLTNACNIRCTGCWYFEGGFDTAVRELSDVGEIRRFAQALRRAGTTQASLIGGEPTLVPQRIEPFVEELPYVIVSTNGLKPMPVIGFENVGVAVSIFGGGPLDDEMRAIRVNGSKFTGLLDTALGHYKDDPRVVFVYALTEAGVPFIEPTVRKIADHGNIVTFNYWSAHGTDDPVALVNEKRLLDEALRVQDLYPAAVVSHPYFIQALITGTSHWGARFGYDVCPSISVDLPEHAARIGNGNPVLTNFAVWGADYKSLQFCCTSGDCGGCRDSQAVQSWLMVAMSHFLEDAARLEQWLDMAESYWSQWVWSPLHRSARGSASDIPHS